MDETTSGLCRDQLGNLWRGDVLVEKSSVEVGDDSFYCIVCQKAIAWADAMKTGGIVGDVKNGGWMCVRHKVEHQGK
jgi:hypothetical protein